MSNLSAAILADMRNIAACFGPRFPFAVERFPLAVELLLLSERLQQATSHDGGTLDLAACRKISEALASLAMVVTGSPEDDRSRDEGARGTIANQRGVMGSRQRFTVISTPIVAQIRACLPMPRGSANLLLLLCLRPGEPLDQKVIEGVLGLTGTSVKVMISNCRRALEDAGYRVQIRNVRSGAYSISPADARTIWEALGCKSVVVS